MWFVFVAFISLSVGILAGKHFGKRDIIEDINADFALVPRELDEDFARSLLYATSWRNVKPELDDNDWEVARETWENIVALADKSQFERIAAAAKSA